MNSALQRYLHDVLGLRWIVMPEQKSSYKVTFVVDAQSYGADEEQLLQKIAQAMKLKSHEFLVQTENNFDNSAGVDVLRFGVDTASLTQMIASPEKKREAWVFMQNMMSRWNQNQFENHK